MPTPTNNAELTPSPRPRKSPLKRALSLIIKLVVAVVGIWFVASKIHWHNTAVIDPAGPAIRNVKFLDPVEVRVLSVEQAKNESLALVRFDDQPHAMEIEDQRITAPVDPTMREITLPFSRFQSKPGGPIHYGLRSILLDARSRWHLLVAAWIILVIPFLVSAIRWRGLMQPQGIHLPLAKCLQLTFVGQFYSIMLPGVTGGDLIKIIYTARIIGSKTKSIVTILLDRVIGLVALMVIAGISAGLQLFLNRRNGAAAGTGNDDTLFKILLMIVAILGGMVLFCIIYFSRRLRSATGLQKIIDHPKMPDFIKHADEVLHVYRGHFGLLAWAFFISLVSQLTLPISAWLSGMAIGIHMSPGYYLAYVPVAILGASLPISPPQGIGFLEYVIDHFFVTRGMATASQAFAITQAIRFLPLMWNLVGAYWVITGKFSRHQAIADERAMDAAVPAQEPH